jgi:hypothetical protein
MSTVADIMNPTAEADRKRLFSTAPSAKKQALKMKYIIQSGSGLCRIARHIFQTDKTKSRMTDM